VNVAWIIKANYESIEAEMEGGILHVRPFYYMGSAEGHEYPNLQVGDEVDPRLSFCVNSKSINSCFF